MFDHYGLDCLYSDLMMNMPFYRQHLKLCPENLINQDITVFLTEKRGSVETKKELEAEASTPSSDSETESQVNSASEPIIPLRNFNREN